MILNDLGKIVEEELLRSEIIRNNINIDEYVIMPNHIHYILVINNCWGVLQSTGCNDHARRRGVLQYAPTMSVNEFIFENKRNNFKSPKNTVGSIVHGNKSATTKKINILLNTPGMPVWQPGFYDHIVRDDDDYLRIVNYIKINPEKWEFDRNYRK
jgi:REP element-mobilizing transposase RayT